MLFNYSAIKKCGEVGGGGERGKRPMKEREGCVRRVSIADERKSKACHTLKGRRVRGKEGRREGRVGGWACT